MTAASLGRVLHEPRTGAIGGGWTARIRPSGSLREQPEARLERLAADDLTKTCGELIGRTRLRKDRRNLAPRRFALR